MTSLIQIANSDVRTSLETTVQIDEGVLYIHHDSLDQRLDAQRNDSWKLFGGEPELGPEWTLGLTLPGATLDSYASGASFAEAFGKLMQLWGAAKAPQYISGLSSHNG